MSSYMAALSEKGDLFKRAELLIDVGTEALRLKFDELNPPKTLQATLLKNKFDIMPRRSRKELDILYPKSGTVSSKKMDLTLLVCVLRNTGLKEPRSTFDCKPDECEISDGADVARLKFYRNELAHSKIKELNEQEFAEMSQALKKVIQSFSGSRFDNAIAVIMTSSLDYRAGSIIWHLKMVIALVRNDLNEFVLQPAKASVIRLNEQQPLPYSIVGGTVLSYSMQDISEIQSYGELYYYLFHVRNLTVRQCFFILYECSFLKQKLTELNLCQRKQDNLLNDIAPVDLRTEGNVTIDGSNSNLPGLLSQSGHVKNTLLLPRSCAIGHTYTNDKLFEEQYYNQLPCLEMVYNILFEQKNSTSYSRLLKGSGSTDSTTEIERCNSFEENVGNNFDAACWIVQTFEFPASSQSSTNYPGSNGLPPHGCVSMKHAEMGCIPSDNSVTNLSESDLKERLSCFIWKKDYEPANKKALDEPHLFCDLRWYFMLTIFLFVLYIIVREVYPYSYAIFESRIHAASLTALVVLLYLMFILQIYINYM